MPLNQLEKLIKEEFDKINLIIDKNNSPFLFIDLLRALDYYWIGEYDRKEEFEHFSQYGYPYFLQRLYASNKFVASYLPLNPSTIDSLSFCHYYLVYYGKLRVAQRATEMAKAQLVNLKQISAKEFDIIIPSTAGVSFWENQSVDEYFRVMSEYVLKERINQLNLEQDKTENLLYTMVESWKDHYIKYDSTPEIDDFYFKKGGIRLNGSQLFDDFDEEYTFGGIKYKYFLDVIQSLMGVALKHIDCCLILCKKNPEIKIYNILPLPQIHDEVIKQYAHYLNIDIDKVKEIMEVLTVSEENISQRIRDDKSFSPPFIKVGNRFVIKSMKGCLHNPIIFLQNELKRRYEKDYMIGLNEREGRFREQLYALFDDKRFIKVKRSVIIKSNIHTDIDAIIFDRQTKSLGLFQLKWQDKFSSDLKARRNRISNFYPKANEWVDKIWQWVSTNKIETILSACQIPVQDISDIFLFVINRYDTHFTNEEKDERAAWGSWYHLLELNHKIKMTFDDPIKELYTKLKIDSPAHKDLPEEYKGSYKLQLDSFIINWKNG